MTALSVIRSIVPLTYILLVSPYLLGSLLCYKLDGELMDSMVLRYVVGFFSQLGIWGFLEMPITVFARESFPFHLLCNIFVALMFMISFVRVVIMIKDKAAIKEHIMRGVVTVRNCANESLVYRFLIVIVSIIMAYQLFQCVYGANLASYSDNYYYTSETLQTIYTDRIYLIGAKAVLAPWRSFYSLVSYAGAVHPIFINETVLPVVILLLFYSSVSIFARFFIEGNRRKSVLFVSLYVFIVLTFGNFMFGNEIAAMHPAIWGKTVLGSIALPMALTLYVLLYNSFDEYKTKKAQYCITFLLYGAGSAWLSMMGMVFMPVGILAVMIVSLVKRRDLTLMWFAFAELVGVLIQAVVYIIGFRIGAA